MSADADPDVEAGRQHAYPQHLRGFAAELPSAPGVYIFHGEEGDLPLYIGKSINLRSRVLSHLRNPDEANLLRQTRRISHIRTAGEIGALLLEASLIKQQQPLLNQKLRRNRQLCSLRLTAGLPEVVYAKDVNFATEPALFGLFASRHAAIEGLRQLADQHRLCYGALGLEKLKPGRACFRASVNLCGGVCRGDESFQAHGQRLFTVLEGLRVACWPYPGAIGLTEHYQDSGQQRAGQPSEAVEAGCQIHVVRNWCYLGSVSDLAKARELDVIAAGFDADGYKILCRPIFSGSVHITPL